MASGADHIDHVRTQLPYAAAAALVSIIFGYLPAGYGFNGWMTLIPLGTGITAVFLLIRFAGKKISNE
jgi:Na+/H+ antiporter NhaC